MDRRLETSLIVRANTQFAFDLYDHIRGEPGNLFISPISISAALTLCYLGAGGSTAAEMAVVMKIRDVADVHERLADLLKTLKIAGEYKLKLANKLFGSERNFLTEFLGKCLKYHSSELISLDFSDETKARGVINNWVEEETEGKIKDLIPAGVLNHLTKLVLVNAIYFKGNWENRFNPQATRIDKFHISENGTKDVEMMFQEDDFYFGYHPPTSCQIISLPYVGRVLSMYVILPTSDDGLGKIERLLSVEFVDDLIINMHTQKVMVFLPKFKFEQTTQLDDVLRKMGINDLFTEKVADLSAMDGTKELYVSKAVHKAFIEVNEDGSEAAAATALAFSTYCMPPEFRANRPFIFFIRDNHTRSLLFVGRVNDPTV